MSQTVNYAVQINGQAVAIVGKVKFKKGFPKVTTKSASIGEDVIPYEDVDYSEAIGTVTIKLPNTARNQGYITDWQRNRGKNALHLTDKASEEVVVFKKQSVSEDVEFEAEDFEVVFTGGQGV